MMVTEYSLAIAVETEGLRSTTIPAGKICSECTIYNKKLIFMIENRTDVFVVTSQVKYSEWENTGTDKHLDTIPNKRESDSMFMQQGKS